MHKVYRYGMDQQVYREKVGVRSVVGMIQCCESLLFEFDCLWEQDIVFFVNMQVQVAFELCQAIDHRSVGIARPLWRLEVVGGGSDGGKCVARMVVLKFHLLDRIGD